MMSVTCNHYPGQTSCEWCKQGIRISEWPFAGNFYAVRDDTYDGPGSPIGSGKTPAEAVADLLEAEDA